MTYDELLDKWLRKLGRPCSAGEIVYDLRQLEQPVRCKDCKHAEFSEAGMTYCPGIIGSWVDDDWFCADGERREEG